MRWATACRDRLVWVIGLASFGASSRRSSSQRLPFVVAGMLSLINFLYGFFVLPESLSPDKHKPFSFHGANPLGAVKFLARSGAGDASGRRCT